MRLLIPNDKPLPPATSDGLEGLPTACFKLDDCAAHRCMKHTTIEVLNEADEWDGFVECGACVADVGIFAFLRARRRIRRRLKIDQRERDVELRRRAEER